MCAPPDPPSPCLCPHHPDDDLALRAVLAAARRRQDPRHPERALLQATDDLTLCSCAAWERLRDEGTTAEQLFAQLQQTRFSSVRPATAPRSSPLGSTSSTPDADPTTPLRCASASSSTWKKYLLGVEDTARRFGVTPQTIYNWIDELRQHPETTSIGSTVVPVPPVRRFSQGVRRLLRQMKDAGFGGKKKIAEILLQNHWRISPRTSAPTPRSRA